MNAQETGAELPQNAFLPSRVSARLPAAATVSAEPLSRLLPCLTDYRSRPLDVLRAGSRVVGDVSQATAVLMCESNAERKRAETKSRCAEGDR